MSKRYNNGGLFVDAGLLRDHVSKLRQEKRQAMRLYESVAAMKGLSDPSVAYQYDSVLRDVEQLIEYFSKMASLLAHISDEAIALSHQLQGLIQDDTEQTHHIVSNTFML